MKRGSTEAARLLRNARAATGLTQSELARRAGISHSVLSAYEHGHRDPGSRALARILAAAGLRLTISRAVPNPEKAGRKLSELLRLTDSLPKRRRKELSFPGLPHR